MATAVNSFLTPERFEQIYSDDTEAFEFCVEILSRGDSAEVDKQLGK